MEPEKTSSQKQKILAAALATIAEHKISGTRMRHIAAQAEMSQGNLHYYFPSKEQLFMALLEEMLTTFVAERKSMLSENQLDPREMLKIFFQQQKEILLERRAYLDVKFDFWVQGTVNPGIAEQIQHMYATWRADIANVVSRGVAQGIFDQTHAGQAPYIMVALMEGATIQSLIVGEDLDLEAYFAAAYRTVLSLLGAALEIETAKS